MPRLIWVFAGHTFHFVGFVMRRVISSLPGVILRDSHGVAQVRFVTGNKILRILKGKGLAPDIPEDLYYLIKKAVNIRKHLERNRKVSGIHIFCTNNGNYWRGPGSVTKKAGRCLKKCGLETWATSWKKLSLEVCDQVRLKSASGERGGSVVECLTPEREVGDSTPTAAVLCPWARHFTPRKYWFITQEAVAPSRHDWKIVDWDVKPQHRQTNQISLFNYRS